MADYNRDWERLGRSIQDAVDRAVNSRDYQKLNQTIRQVVGRAVDLGSEAVRKAMDARPTPGAPGAGQPAAAPAPERQKPLPVLYGSTGSKSAAGVLKMVGGGLLSLFTFLFLCGTAAYNLMAGIGLLTIPVALALIFLVVGVGLICSGAATLGMLRRFKIYRGTLGQKTYCSLEKLARSVGKSVKFVRRELRRMMKEGLFLEGHMDREETCLITSDETYRYFEQSRLQLEQRQRQEAAAKVTGTPRSSQVQEVLNRGNAYIAEIRRCNDAIPGEEISGKISRMETIIQTIFEWAEAHPEIVPDLKKLMDYYLPMTVKLLNAYADMDAQPIQGETIQFSKKEIEATLDTLNLAFEKLLDSVFRDTAMDVSSDISVLNTLLAQEGLTEDEFTKLKKNRTT